MATSAKVEGGLEASLARDVPAKGKRAKPAGGAKRPSGKPLRIQLHIGEDTIKRLGVHCSLVHRDKSAMVDEVLSAWLSRYGQGRELFKTRPDLLGPGGDADPDVE